MPKHLYVRLILLRMHVFCFWLYDVQMHYEGRSHHPRAQFRLRGRYAAHGKRAHQPLGCIDCSIWLRYHAIQDTGRLAGRGAPRPSCGLERQGIYESRDTASAESVGEGIPVSDCVLVAGACYSLFCCLNLFSFSYMYMHSCVF